MDTFLETLYMVCVIYWSYNEVVLTVKYVFYVDPLYGNCSSSCHTHSTNRSQPLHNTTRKERDIIHSSRKTPEIGLRRKTVVTFSLPKEKCKRASTTAIYGDYVKAGNQHQGERTARLRKTANDWLDRNLEPWSEY